MATENVELAHKYFPQHLNMGTARLIQDKETDEEGKKKRKYGTKQSRHKREKSRCPSYSYLL